MRRDVRFNRRRAGMAAIAGLAALVALIATASAPAAHDGAGATQAGHACLVMAGWLASRCHPGRNGHDRD
jgi:hypothetical protein